MASFPDPRFRVIWSEQNRDAVRNIGNQAIQRGEITEFVRTIRHIEEELETDPLSWGDPYYELKTTGLTLCHRIYGGVHVFYAVDERNRLVFIRDVEPYP